MTEQEEAEFERGWRETRRKHDHEFVLGMPGLLAVDWAGRKIDVTDDEHGRAMSAKAKRIGFTARTRAGEKW